MDQTPYSHNRKYHKDQNVAGKFGIQRQIMYMYFNLKLKCHILWI